MSTTPRTPDHLALARDTLTNLPRLKDCTPEQRADLVRAALETLQTDRLCRQAAPARPEARPATLVIIPSARWQAGSRSHRVLRIHLPVTPTPGDAA